MKQWALLLLVVITVLGAGFRWYELGEKSLWSDEIATIATSLGNSIDPEAYALRGETFDPSGPVPATVYQQKATHSHGAGNFAQTAQVLKMNVHPPLFFWLMNIWIHATGLSPEALRIPAVWFGILNSALMYWLALRIADLNGERFSPAARQGFALLSASIMALSAYQVDHAQDARQYTFLIALALLATGLAIRLVQPKKPPAGWLIWLLLGLCLAAGLYTQYFFFLFAAFIVMYVAWQGHRQPGFWPRFGGMLLLMGLLLLPWMGHFQAQLGFLKTAGHYTAGLWKPLPLLEKLWRIQCEFFLPDHPLGKAIPLVILLSALAASRFPGATNQLKARGLSPALQLILLWLIVVIGGQVMLDVVKQSHTATIRRYLLLASPACYLLMAYGLVFIARQLPKRWGIGLSSLLSLTLLGSMATDTYAMLSQSHTSSDEFKQAAEWINRRALPGDLVVVSKSGAMAVGMAYYLQPQIRMMGVDVPSPDTLLPAAPKFRQLQRALPVMPKARVWLVFSHAAPSTESRLTQWIAKQHYHTEAAHKFPGVKVALWSQ